jgi:predicted PhzF superfamily epimerase YddE/YHI9
MCTVFYRLYVCFKRSYHWFVRFRFTPNTEVALCGHATLAAAHALFETRRANRALPLRFHTRSSGVLGAIALQDGSIELDFPSTPPLCTVLSVQEELWLMSGLGIIMATDVLFVGRTTFDLFVELRVGSFMRVLRSNIPSISDIAQIRSRGVIISCAGRRCINSSDDAVDLLLSTEESELFEKYDFLSRFFAPRYNFKLPCFRRMPPPFLLSGCSGDCVDVLIVDIVMSKKCWYGGTT